MCIAQRLASYGQPAEFLKKKPYDVIKRLREYAPIYLQAYMCVCMYVHVCACAKCVVTYDSCHVLLILRSMVSCKPEVAANSRNEWQHVYQGLHLQQRRHEAVSPAH